MLTCNVGEKTINTIDHSDSDIRNWSNKKILKCPVCGADMIYKNGNYKVAHFAHTKNSECSLMYAEPESDEHLTGKKNLYKWLKTQNIQNLKLEAWIPETKQRPDVYFEYESDKYVIEYQCTPIAKEYKERHELYKFAGIKDIWILGTKKYELRQEKIDMLKKHNENFTLQIKTKTIDRELVNENGCVYYIQDKSLFFAKKFNKERGLKTVFNILFDTHLDINRLNINDFIEMNLQKDNGLYFKMDSILSEYSECVWSNRFLKTEIKKDVNKLIVFSNAWYEKYAINTHETLNYSRNNLVRLIEEYTDEIKKEKLKQHYVSIYDKIYLSKEKELLKRLVDSLNNRCNGLYWIPYGFKLEKDEENKTYVYKIHKDSEKIYEQNSLDELDFNKLSKILIEGRKYINELNKKSNELFRKFNCETKYKAKISYERFLIEGNGIDKFICLTLKDIDEYNWNFSEYLKKLNLKEV